MSENYERLCRDRAGAYQAARDAYTVAQAFLASERPVWIRCTEDLEPVTARQRRFWHGPVLRQISEQAWVVTFDKAGKPVLRERMVMEWWKEFFRVLLLERKPKWEMQRRARYDPELGRMVIARRKTPVRIRQSTEDLGVKAYSAYIDEGIAFAASEFSVQFVFDIDERESVRYVPRKRHATAPKAAAHQREEIT